MSTIHASNQTKMFPVLSLKDGSKEVIVMQERECRNGNVCYSFSLDSIPSAEQMSLAVASALVEGAKAGFDVKVGKDHRFVTDQHGKKVFVNLQVVYWNNRKPTSDDGQLKDS